METPAGDLPRERPHCIYIVLSDIPGVASQSGILYNIRKGMLLDEDAGSGVLLTSDLSDTVTTFNRAVIPGNAHLELLAKDVFVLLYPVTKPENRYTIYTDKVWLYEGRNLKVGDTVTISGVKNLPSHATAVIRFKGPMENHMFPGIHFGVELLPEYDGLGSSSGSFRKVEYFKTGKNCALFVTLYQIRKKFSPESPAPEMSDPTYFNFRSSGAPDSVQLHQRVVWLSDNGPERGVVRWLGRLQGLDPTEDLYAGVAFDNAIGKGTGRFRGTQLFSSERDHASLVPVVGLIRETDFNGTSIDRNTAGVHEDSPSPLRQTPDIVISASQGARGANPIHPGNQAPAPESTPLSASISLRSGEPPSASVSYNFKSDSSISAKGVQGSLGSTDGPPGDLHKQVHAASPRVSRDTPGHPGVVPRREDHIQAPAVPGRALQLGDYVQVPLVPPRRGIVRWLSSLEPSNESDPVITGLEMDDEDPACYTDGAFLRKKRFDCKPHRALFIHAHMCKLIASHRQ